jgi:hypothetical protein
MKRQLLVVITMFAFLFFASTVYADFTWEYSNSVVGPLPTGSQPWLTVAFSDDVVNTNLVNMTISGVNLDSGPDTREYLRAIAFNLDPVFAPNALSFTFIDGVEAQTINNAYATSHYTMDGLTNLFDVQIGFDGGTFSNDSDAYSNIVGNYSIYQISMMNGSLDLDAEDFLYTSQGDGTPYYSVAELRGVQNLPSTDGQALIAPVPVPAAVWLLGSGLVGLVGLRRKMKS